MVDYITPETSRVPIHLYSLWQSTPHEIDNNLATWQIPVSLNPKLNRLKVLQHVHYLKPDLEGAEFIRSATFSALALLTDDLELIWNVAINRSYLDQLLLACDTSLAFSAFNLIAVMAQKHPSLRLPQLNFISSSGESLVALHAQDDLVYQHFPQILGEFQPTYARILELMFAIDRHRADDATTHHIVTLRGWDTKAGILIWDRLQTYTDLNRLPNLWVQNNYLRILWDGFQGLGRIHRSGWAHRDATLDNTGILRGQVVLFDFNLASKLIGVETSSTDLHLIPGDYLRLVGSVALHAGRNLSTMITALKQLSAVADTNLEANSMSTIKTIVEYCHNVLLQFIMEVENVKSRVAARKLIGHRALTRLHYDDQMCQASIPDRKP
jgi:hypothetical protein